MKNGKEYCQSIHQQIVDLLDKCRLGDEERVAVNRLPSGKWRSSPRLRSLSFNDLRRTVDTRVTRRL